MKKSLLKNYANLIAKMGVNVQKGQDVYVVANLDQPEFVAMVVEALYKLGANKVYVDWGYEPLGKIHVKYQSAETLGKVDRLALEKIKWRSEELPAHLYIVSDDPDSMKGVDMDKYVKAQRSKMKVIKPYRDSMENKYQWCIAAVPGKKWAKKVFPELPVSKAVEKLWESILAASRAMEDPIEAWNLHNSNIKEKCGILNKLQLVKLHYTSDNGTDLTVGLNELGKFNGGYDTTLSGVSFNPNIPSEEVFTSPKAGVAEGIVYSTKPLSYNGQLIEDFFMRFENGRVVEVGAKKNKALLEKMVSTDNGAAMLGECAFVPYDSPINNTGILFYETLFDENASCHLAVGRGFPDCLEGFENMTIEEQHAAGINDSAIHVDFMIGTNDLKVVGTDIHGKEIVIFKDGSWNF